MFDFLLNAESNIFLLIVGLIVGFVLIIFGGDKFVDSAIWIAVKTKIPQMIIGATLVSIGTTLPELFTSYTAAAKGLASMSVGNALGSIMCNTSLILAISLTASPSFVHKGQFWPKFAILSLSVAMLFVFALFEVINIWECVVLLIICVGYFAYNIVSALRNAKKVNKESLAKSVCTDSSQADAQEDGEDFYAEYRNKKSWLMILFFVLGAAGIAVGAQLMVASVSSICVKLGISEAVVSLTVVAFGTSLPELVTALTSLKKNSTEISLGNIIGANILNATLIVGGSGLIASGLKIPPADTLSVIVTCGGIIAVLLILGLPILVKKRTYRLQGISMLCIYAAYLGFLIWQLIATEGAAA